MFERIVIRRHSTSKQLIDAGTMAETLLFYENVHVLFDAGSLASVIRAIGADNLLDLISRKRITASFLLDNLGTYSDTPLFGSAVHSFTSIRLAKEKDGRKIKRKDLVARAFDNAMGKSKLSRIRAEQFMRHAFMREYVSANPVLGSSTGSSITEQAFADLDGRDYVRGAVQTILKMEVPSIAFPTNWTFEVAKLNSSQFTVTTNLDLAAINREYHKRVLVSENSITVPWLLSNLLETRGDLYFASDYMAELATDPLKSNLIQLRFGEFLQRRLASAREISSFQEIHLNHATAIREAINSGERSFEDFMKLLDRADKFREWLRVINPDAQLLDEYLRAATEATWADSLPTKTTRFVICALAGGALEAAFPTGFGLAAGTGLGLADSLWLDRLIKGWRPNQFVGGALKRFVDTN